MLRTAIALLCAVAVLAPAAAFARDRDYGRGWSRPDDNRYRYPQRERAIDFDNRQHTSDRRDDRWNDRRDDREWNRRDESRGRDWRDRRDDRFRRDYRRDRYEERRIIIIPHFSF